MEKIVTLLALVVVLNASADDQIIQPTQSTGVVSWYDRENGYGFITPYDSNIRVFVHFSAIVSPNQQMSLYQGQTVRFAMMWCDGSAQALWVLPE